MKDAEYREQIMLLHRERNMQLRGIKKLIALASGLLIVTLLLVLLFLIL